MAWNIVYAGSMPGNSAITPAAGQLSVSANNAVRIAATFIQPSAASLSVSGNAPTIPGTFNANFAPTANPIDTSTYLGGHTDGGTWQDMQSNSGNAYGTGFTGGGSGGTSEFDDNLAVVKSNVHAFTANQYIQGTVHLAGGYSPTTNHEIELLVRFSISNGDAHGYEVLWGIHSGAAYLAVVKWNGSLGSFVAIKDPGDGSIAFPTNGDVLRVEITGTTLTVKLNGSAVSGFSNLDLTKDQGGGTISTWSSGQIGIGSWIRSDGSTVFSSYGWSALTAGDL